MGVVMTRFFPDTLLLRMRLKLCLRDFFKDLTLDRGPSMARESFGCSVHLGEHKKKQSCWQCPLFLLKFKKSVSKTVVLYSTVYIHYIKYIFKKRLVLPFTTVLVLCAVFAAEYNKDKIKSSSCVCRTWPAQNSVCGSRKGRIHDSFRRRSGSTRCAAPLP